MNEKKLKNFRFLLFVFAGWWLFYALCSGGSVFDVSYAECQEQRCSVFVKSWFGWGKLRDKVVFAQEVAKDMKMRQASGRLPYYYFYLYKEDVTECMGREKANNVSLPMNFYWRQSAHEYYRNVHSMQDFKVQKMALDFLYFGILWLISILLSSLIILLKKDEQTADSTSEENLQS